MAVSDSQTEHVSEVEAALLDAELFMKYQAPERAIKRLSQEGFRPYWHQRIPPNDGGIALGQLAAARYILSSLPHPKSGYTL